MAGPRSTPGRQHGANMDTTESPVSLVLGYQAGGGVVSAGVGLFVGFNDEFGAVYTSVFLPLFCVILGFVVAPAVSPNVIPPF